MPYHVIEVSIETSDSETQSAYSKEGSTVVASNLGGNASASIVRPERNQTLPRVGGGTSGIATYSILGPAASGSPAGRGDAGTSAPQGSDAPVASDPVPATPEQLVRKLGPAKKPGGKQRSIVWKSILLLKDDDVRRLKFVADKRATHYCFIAILSLV